MRFKLIAVLYIFLSYYIILNVSRLRSRGFRHLSALVPLNDRTFCVINFEFANAEGGSVYEYRIGSMSESVYLRSSKRKLDFIFWKTWATMNAYSIYSELLRNN